MKRTRQAAIAAAAIAAAPATAFGTPAFATDSDSSTATSWFSRSAEDAARSKAGDTFGSRYDVKVGEPTHASVFAGDKDNLRVTDSDYWAAPVKSGDKVLGTIAVKVTDGKVGAPIFTAEETFGKELANRTPNTTVVEWGEGKVEVLTPDRLTIKVARPTGGEEIAADCPRKLTFEATGERSREILRGLEARR